MNFRQVAAVVLIALASGALAHQNVKNPAVKARMDAMSAIGAGMKVLGEMAKGEVSFDAGRARGAAATIATHAATVPALFKARENDPVSEARPEIWDSFDDFAAKSRDMEKLASDLSRSITDAGDLDPAVRALGASCSACHKPYRE